MEIDLLFADEDELLREVYLSYFSRHGLVVQTAADGPECLDKLRTTFPHMIVFDVDLLSCDGEERLLAIREEMAFCGASVVIATGDGTPLELSSRTGLSSRCCFSKPYSLVSLWECMRAETAQLRDGPQKHFADCPGLA